MSDNRDLGPGAAAGSGMLLHCCCGPCAVAVIRHFEGLGERVTAWYYNPNIYPPAEMRLRQQALHQACVALGVPVLPPEPEPRPEEFLLALGAAGGRRCHTCYRLRLEAAACKARALRFRAFSTTLTVSPYQDLEAIRQIGAAAAARHGVAFVAADLRHQHRGSQQQARELGLYRQNYCGCLFSGLERAAGRIARALARLRC